MLNLKKLSVIIVNYQSELYLQKCLDSLFAHNFKIDLEVLIVNNDEKEKLEKIKKQFPEVILIKSPKNNGFGAACNLGVNHARGEILFFLNPDAEILSSIEPIIKILERDPEIGAIGPKLLEQNGKTQEWSTGVEISLLDLIRNNLGLPRSKKIWKSLIARETFWTSGAAVFISRKVFFEIGGFDEKFFMYFEDMDLCRRLRKAGKKVLYFPEVAILHLGGRSSQGSQKQKALFFASQDYYFQKHFGKFQVFCLKLLRKIFLRK